MSQRNFSVLNAVLLACFSFLVNDSHASYDFEYSPSFYLRTLDGVPLSNVNIDTDIVIEKFSQPGGFGGILPEWHVVSIDTVHLVTDLEGKATTRKRYHACTPFERKPETGHTMGPEFTSSVEYRDVHGKTQSCVVFSGMIAYERGIHFTDGLLQITHQQLDILAQNRINICKEWANIYHDQTSNPPDQLSSLCGSAEDVRACEEKAKGWFGYPFSTP